VGCVDVVVIFDDVTANALVALAPRHLCQGRRLESARRARPPEAEIVIGYGGRVVYLLHPERSTTALIEKIADLGLRPAE